MNIRHKLIDVFVFSSIFFSIVLLFRSWGIKNPKKLREWLLKYGFIKDGSGVIKGSDLVASGAKYTPTEAEFLREKGYDVDDSYVLN